MMIKKRNKKLSTVLSALVISLGMIPTSFADNTMEDLSRVQNAEIVETLDHDNDDKGGNLEGIQIQLGVVDVDEQGNIENIYQKASGNLETELEISDVLSDANQKTASNVSYLLGSNRYETAVKISQKGWPSGAKNVVLVNSSSTISGTIATPLATTYNAPILLSGVGSINNTTIREIKRLKPSKVYIIGNTNSLSLNVEQTIKLMGIVPKRISGTTIGQTSANKIGRASCRERV